MSNFNLYAGDTDATIYVGLRDATTGLAKTGIAYNSAGAVCSYTLPRAARAAITLATQTVTGAHTDGGFVEVDATNCKGLYRLDLPDAAIASGDYTIISIEFDGVMEESIAVPLYLRKVNTATIADAVWDEDLSTGHTVANSAAVFVNDIYQDTDGTLPGSLATIYGLIDTEVAAIKSVTDQFVFTVANQVDANALATAAPTAAAIADAVWDEDLSTGHTVANSAGVYVNDIYADTDSTLPASLSTIHGLIDTEVAAIKSVTDQFVFTVANQVDANALSGGGGGDGSGLTAIPWNAAWDAEVQSEVEDAIDVKQADFTLPATNASGYVTASNTAVGVALPVSQVPVPESRTVHVVKTANGLYGEFTETLHVGESKIFAVDFANDLPVNGRMSGIDSVTIDSGTAGGITFVTAEHGADKSQLKIKPTAVTAGTYVISCKVLYSPNGEEAEALVTLKVV